MTAVLAQLETAERLQLAGVQIAGLVLAAAVVTALAAVLYRRRTTRPLPVGTGAFLGLVTVGGWLFVEGVRGGPLVPSLAIDHYGSAIYAVVAVGLGAVVGVGGRSLGDRLACEVYGIERIPSDEDAAELLRSARLLVAVTLPEAVEDAEGYGAASDETRRALAGRRFLFPRRLSGDELADRVESRIVTDFVVDHANVELSGTDVEALSVGTRPSGLGPTLPPGTAAVGIIADPAGDVSPGDPVEIWQHRADGNRLVARGRFRAGTGDLATVVVDQDDATAFETTQRYRLVTPQATPSDHHRLAALLGSVDETTIGLSVRRGDDLDGEFVGWLPGAVLAIERDDAVLVLPDDRVTLRDGDTVFLAGHPSDLEAHEVSVGSARPAEAGPDGESDPSQDTSASNPVLSALEVD